MYFTKRIFFSFSILFFIPYLHAHAIVAAPVALAISLFEIFSVAVLILIIPTTLVGLAMRIIGARRGTDGKWILHPKEMIAVIIKYVLYHALLAAGLWALTFLPPLQPVYLFYFILALHAFIFATIGPYVVFLFNKTRHRETFQPSIWVHVRLWIWNGIFIILLQLLFNYLLKNYI